MSLFIRCRDVSTGKYCAFEQVLASELEHIVPALKEGGRVTAIQVAEDDNENFRILRTVKQDRNWQ